MRVSAIVEARMGSSRLPGKVMFTVGGNPLLQYQLQRLSACDLIDTLIVATPSGEENAPIWDFCAQMKVRLIKGLEEDVLSRVLQAAIETHTDVICEITGDCPLIDPDIVDLCIGYLICGDWHCVGNDHPHTWPKGMDCRVFRTSTLNQVNEAVKGDERESYWREHVSPFIYDRDDTPYKCLNLTAPDDCTYPDLNLSVDTMADFKRVSGIIESLHAGNPLFNIKDVLQYLAVLPGYEMLTASNLYTVPEWAKGDDCKPSASRVVPAV